VSQLSAVEEAVAEAGSCRDDRIRGAGEGWRLRGVVHTPKEVARFVVTRVDEVLKKRFGLRGGLAEPRVAILDPACGPGVFLAAALGLSAKRRGAPGRFVGIDLDGDAVSEAARLLGPSSERAGWPLELRTVDTLADLAPFGAELAADAIVVIVGNPPWASKSANKEAATSALLEDFRRDANGKRLEERKLGVLSDDYVRFYRWAAEMVRRSPGGGVIGLATNGSFLDGPVHAGMRGALVRWLDGIDVVDIGGSALLSSDGVKDENVFGVRPSVALTIGFRAPALPNVRRARVRHTALRGTRSEKLARLAAPDFTLDRVRAAEPSFLFVPAPRDARYESWPALDELFRFHAEGVQTNRDEAVIDTDPERLLMRIEAFVKGTPDDTLAKARMKSGHYDPEKARRRLERALAEDRSALVHKIAYRPFDDRYFVPITPFCHRPRPRLARAIAHGGPIVVTVRKDRGKKPWSHFGAVSAIVDNCYLSNRSSCRTRAFPAFDPEGRDNLEPNGAAAIVAGAGGDARAADVLPYVLAVLASADYRRRYDRFLRLSYPRIPPPPDAETFARVGAVGRELIAAFGQRSSDEVGASDPVSVGHHSLEASSLARAVNDATEIVAPILDRD
jgi:hypothetical protein